MEQIHLAVIAFVQIKSINRADNTLMTDSPGTKLYTLFRTERTKTKPCPAAHPRICNIRELPLGLPVSSNKIGGDGRLTTCYSSKENGQYCRLDNFYVLRISSLSKPEGTKKNLQ